MAEEDNFDIDIYGDGGEDYHQEATEEDVKVDNPAEQPAAIADTINQPPDNPNFSTYPASNDHDTHQEAKLGNGHMQPSDVAQKISSTDDSTQDPVHLPKQAPQTQGLKRKDGTDDRNVDPGATTALFISELHWWVTDDDIRGWANQSQCEDELDDITFSEHKVNGKSKGQAYVLFKSPQAATAAKQKIESFGEGQQYTKKFTVSYTNPFTNPFRTLPKDGPMRNNNTTNSNRSASGGYGSGGMNSMPPQPMGYNMNNSTAGYRGGRGGGYNSRGGINNMSGYSRGGFQQPMAGGFQGTPMGGYQGSPMGGMQPYGGFQNRAGMMGGMRGAPMGMRGGRGGMSPNGMMGMPMGAMGIGGMGSPMGNMAMGMPQMNGGIGMQGMQGFHNYPNANMAVSYMGPTAQAGHWAPSPYVTRQPVGPGFGGQPSHMRGGHAPSPQPGAHRPSLNQYSPATSSTSLSRFPSQPTASTFATSPQPPEQNNTLKRTLPQSGQAGFQTNQAHYNPAFFSQQQQSAAGAGDANWNPHGAKRTRQE